MNIIKRSLAVFMAILFTLAAMPVSALTFLRGSTLYTGGAFMLFSDGMSIAADIVSAVGGVAAKAMPETQDGITDDLKWLYTENQNLVCGEFYLCATENTLLVSPDAEYALKAVQSGSEVVLFSGDREIKLAYSSEYSAFVIAKQGDTQCAISAVECTNTVSVTGVELDASEITLYKGESALLTATVYPENATDKAITWETSNEAVATCTDGNIVAIDEGTCQVCAVTNDGEFKASCTVTVEKKYYTVNFYDFYNNLIVSESVEENTPVTPPENPSADGYEFIGWSESDLSCITHDLDVYSLWNISTFSIEFELNGGKCDNLPTAYTIESEDIALPTPEKAYYSFTGWYNNPEFTGEIILRIEKGSVGNKKFYASYTPERYTIKYELNGGSFTGSAITSYTIESPDIYLPSPIKRGYDFCGWYASADFSGDIICVIESGSHGDIQLFAKYTPVTYTITYECNGGRLSGIYPLTYTSESPDITLPTPTKRGYQFAGWYLESDLSGERIYIINSGSIGNKTFYAAWELEEYSITYEANGGILSDDCPSSYTVVSDTVVLPVPVKTGYAFCGWYDNPEFSGSAVECIESGTVGNLTFYARWDTVEYTIAFHPNGGTIQGSAPAGYNIESERLYLPTAKRTAYNFSGWFDNEGLSGDAVEFIETGSHGDKSFFAAWTPVEYTITYNLSGGIFESLAIKSYTIESPDIVLPNAYKTGYTFCGWFESPDFSGEAVELIASGSYGDKVLYACFEALTYTITYNLNGGILTSDAPTSYTIESETITLPEPSKRGYSFAGWYRLPSLSGDRVYEIVSGSYGNVSFYAAWTPTQYTITYETYGGTMVGEAASVYTVETADITLPLVIRQGYKFMGWYDNPDFNGDIITVLKKGSVGNRTFYARYATITYSITYELSGGTLPDDAVTSFDIETETFMLPVPQRDGYSFAGFFTSPALTGEQITHIEKGTTGNITLYAAWDIINYSITYYVYDGIMPDEEYALSYNIESDTIVLPRPAMTGHVFVGWYDNPEFRGVAIREIKTGSFGDKVFYANWRRLIYTVRFFDFDGETLLSKQYVEYGTSATPPETMPEHYGYYFAGWDKDYTFIESNLDCIAVYELVEYDVVFVDLDYSVISIQKVKHGMGAIAPTPPEHEGCVFVFWSCDFDCVTSDLTVVAVYRATTVTPSPKQGQRFVPEESIEEGSDCMFLVKEGEKLYALSSLGRFENNGLWGIEVISNSNVFSTADPEANISDCVFKAEVSGNEGFSLISESSGEKLSYESGDFVMCSIQERNDLFTYVYENGAYRLYNTTNGVYLKYNAQEGYFESGSIGEASEVYLYSRINLPDYFMSGIPSYGSTYTIVAQRPDGSTFALAETDGELTGIPVDIFGNRLFFNDNIDERTVAFRAVFGSNGKGITFRNAALTKYLGVEGENVVLSDNHEFYWSYKENTDSGNMTLTEVNLQKSLFCDENGNFTAQPSPTHSRIFLYERKPVCGSLGDVNLDGAVNTGDAVMLLRYAAELITLHEDQLALSDTNDDGRINVGDVVMILRYTVGIIDWIG